MKRVPNTIGRAVSAKRSLVKAITYRIIIIILDFTVIYFLTRRVEIAVGFMVISNIYTTLAYFLHERLWSRIRWGTKQLAPCGLNKS